MYQIQLVNHDSAMYHHSASITEEDNASIFISTPLGSNESDYYRKAFTLNLSSAFRQPEIHNVSKNARKP